MLVGQNLGFFLSIFHFIGGKDIQKLSLQISLNWVKVEKKLKWTFPYQGGGDGQH